MTITFRLHPFVQVSGVSLGPLPSAVPVKKKNHGEIVIAFTKNRTLGIRNHIVIEATNPRPARSRAYASPIPLPRPSPGSLPARAGSPLAGQDSHLRDNERNFMESSQFLQSQSTSSAWSHLNLPSACDTLP